MKRRRWRRSTEAEPDEIETNSILHRPGLFVHAVTRVQEKKLQIHARLPGRNTRRPWQVSTDAHGAFRVAFRVVNGHVTRGLRGRSTEDACFCSDLFVKEDNGTFKAVLATGLASLVWAWAS